MIFKTRDRDIDLSGKKINFFEIVQQPGNFLVKVDTTAGVYSTKVNSYEDALDTIHPFNKTGHEVRETLLKEPIMSADEAEAMSFDIEETDEVEEFFNQFDDDPEYQQGVKDGEELLNLPPGLVSLDSVTAYTDETIEMAAEELSEDEDES